MTSAPDATCLNPSARHFRIDGRDDQLVRLGHERIGAPSTQEYVWSAAKFVFLSNSLSTLPIGGNCTSNPRRRIATLFMTNLSQTDTDPQLTAGRESAHAGRDFYGTIAGWSIVSTSLEQ